VKALVIVSPISWRVLLVGIGAESRELYNTQKKKLHIRYCTYLTDDRLARVYQVKNQISCRYLLDTTHIDPEPSKMAG